MNGSRKPISKSLIVSQPPRAAGVESAHVCKLAGRAAFTRLNHRKTGTPAALSFWMVSAIQLIALDVSLLVDWT